MPQKVVIVFIVTIRWWTRWWIYDDMLSICLTCPTYSSIDSGLVYKVPLSLKQNCSRKNEGWQSLILGLLDIMGGGCGRLMIYRCAFSNQGIQVIVPHSNLGIQLVTYVLNEDWLWMWKQCFMHEKPNHMAHFISHWLLYFAPLKQTARFQRQASHTSLCSQQCPMNVMVPLH